MNAAITKAHASGAPIFAYMSQYALHVPFQYPDKRFTLTTLNSKVMPQSRLLVEGMDKSLGDILLTIEKLGEARTPSSSSIQTMVPSATRNPHSQRKKRHSLRRRLQSPLDDSWAKNQPIQPTPAKAPHQAK
ncbi:hypothetical protein [Rubritalea tangerina]|uniref:hypothetical protein n=1 Tax=Rubritalea tangerina TaxID=430798 RepID=UPI003608EA7F